MIYEKSHNLLLHAIYYEIKRLNGLYFTEMSERFRESTRAHNNRLEHLADPNLKSPLPLFFEKTRFLEQTELDSFEFMFPLLDVARESFPEYNTLFDWIATKKNANSVYGESCWCLGCKRNREIFFEERPEFGLPPAMVPIGNTGMTPPPVVHDFKIMHK
jgi:hypothetical protein